MLLFGWSLLTLLRVVLTPALSPLPILAGHHSPLHSDACALSQAQGGGPAPAAQEDYSIPYRLDETQHLAVRAKINGRGPFNFIIDTGAPAVFVTKEVAARCGIKPDAEGWGTLDHLEIEGGATAERVQARIEEPFQLQGMNALGLASEHLDGILGYNLLARFRIQIDLTRSKMLWTPSGFVPDLPTHIEGLTTQERAVMQKAGKNQEEMEGMAKMVSGMFARQKALQTVRRGFFGLELEDTPQGARIRTVIPAGPAAQAGLAAGDLIVKIVPPKSDGEAVRTSADVLRLTAHVAPGESALFVLKRGTERLKRAVSAGKEGF